MYSTVATARVLLVCLAREQHSRYADATQPGVADPTMLRAESTHFPPPPGFHELVPPELISIFTPKELELLISGLPDVDLDDLQVRTKPALATVACSSRHRQSRLPCLFLRRRISF